jgi:hypothetical protein
VLEEKRILPGSRTFRWTGLTPTIVGIVLIGLGVYGLVKPGEWKSGPELARRIYGGCVLLGAGFLLFQRGARLNREDRTVTTWWGFRFPILRRVRSLDDFEWVTIADETHVHGHGGSISYPVRLYGSGGNVKIADSWSFDRSWLRAKEAAEFLELKLWDATSERPLELDALETPLYRRLDPALTLTPPPPPASARSRLSENEYGLTVVVPETGFGWFHLVLGLVLPPVLACAFRYHHRVDQAFRCLQDPWFWAFTVFFAILLIGASVVGATLREQVTVSKSDVRLLRRSWFGRKEQSIPLEEVLQVEVVGRPINYNALPRLTASKLVIEIRGVHRILGFGSGLAEEELRWLVHCLQGGLARYGR